MVKSFLTTTSAWFCCIGDFYLSPNIASSNLLSGETESFVNIKLNSRKLLKLEKLLQFPLLGARWYLTLLSVCNYCLNVFTCVYCITEFGTHCHQLVIIIINLRNTVKTCFKPLCIELIFYLFGQQNIYMP